MASTINSMQPALPFTYRVGGSNNAAQSAASGISAAELALDVAASNVANVNTPGYAPSHVTEMSTAGGGVAAQVVAANVVPQLEGGSAMDAVAAQNGVDIGTEMVSTIAASAALKANISVLRADQDTQKALIDILR